MNLKVLLPYQVFADKADVLRIEAETSDGSFGLLEHRRDCVAALAPGILAYQASGCPVVYLAVDRGVLVKAGALVLVSVRRAIEGTSLGELHDAIKRQFLTLDEQERDVRAAIARMEGSFMRHLQDYAHER